MILIIFYLIVFPHAFYYFGGYLYALHDQTPNKERLGKRVRTLLFPYLIWSALGIALVYVLELFPYTKQLVIDSHVVQIDNERMQVHQYHWYETIARWLFFRFRISFGLFVFFFFIT